MTVERGLSSILLLASASRKGIRGSRCRKHFRILHFLTRDLSVQNGGALEKLRPSLASG